EDKILRRHRISLFPLLGTVPAAKFLVIGLLAPPPTTAGEVLDGRSLTIPVSNVIHPTYEEVVPREGMSIPRDQTRRGNLRIKFSIRFPTRLAAEQKADFKKLLAA
ncbi:DnaJ homolog subfamily B member 13, partial [Linum perenne]